MSDTVPRPVAPPARADAETAKLAQLCAERNSLPWGDPRRGALAAEIADLAGRLEWIDQWASSPADLSSHAPPAA